MLRTVLVTAVFLACVHFVDSSQAQIVEGPWCAIRNFGSDISEDCQFRTFEECPGDRDRGVPRLLQSKSKVAKRTGETAAAPERLSPGSVTGPLPWLHLGSAFGYRIGLGGRYRFSARYLTDAGVAQG
jgi:hypothetical protein